MSLLENLLVCLTVLASVFVGGTVFAFTLVPFNSGIPCVAVDSELATDGWLEAQRQRHQARARPVET